MLSVQYFILIVLIYYAQAENFLDKLSNEHIDQLDNELERYLQRKLSSNNEEIIRKKFSTNVFEHFNGKPQKLTRHVRSSGCAGSAVGNLGFNSFNFLTFMVMTFNAVANTNNNINNNNDNNNDINMNSISQDSNNVVSNSDNMNMIMVMILPVGGKRSLPRVKQLFNNNKCSNNGFNTTTNFDDFMAIGKLVCFKDLHFE